MTLATPACPNGPERNDAASGRSRRFLHTLARLSGLDQKSLAALGRVRRVLTAVAPSLSAPWAFVLGASLILTGAAPITHDHLAAVEEAVPLPLVETAHLMSLLSGLGLMGSATGFWRRRCNARSLGLVLSAAAAASALARGLDWGQTWASLALAGLLALTGPAFYRKADHHRDALDKLTDVGVVAVFAGSVALGLWCYHRTPFDGSLFTRVGYHADPARFLRGTALLGAVFLWVGARRLAGVSRPRCNRATPEELAALRPLIESSPNTQARLALTGDKSILAHEDGSAFMMWASQGGSLVVMGDPVGDADAGRALMWRFRERADRIDARPVFYQVSAARLADYLDLGLALVKLGEEALVPLDGFSLDGGSRKRLRQTIARGQREGLAFEVLRPPISAALMAELAEVSDSWLTTHGRREKGFSLGRFDPDTLRREPVAVVRREGRIVAFANVWTGGRVEAAIDLMRHRPDAPAGVMEFLLIELLLWAKAEAFERFSLGMAPLSGLVEHPLAPLWHKLGRIVAKRGARFYGFEGLRAFKQKFDPVWVPRYLAAPPRQVPQALIDVARLIARPAPPLPAAPEPPALPARPKPALA